MTAREQGGARRGAGAGAGDAAEELEGCALVRELHVYGSLVKSNDKVTKAAQHVG